jgi:NAD(P)-dependent dehydrogenase (short-subunit alcohol dehydrogenase family)
MARKSMKTEKDEAQKAVRERQQGRRQEPPPPQHQERQPGRESEMEPAPQSHAAEYLAAGKLKDQVALITGGDSGIGRAVAIAFAKEGADVAIVYLNQHGDAEETQRSVEEQHRRCLLIQGDVGDHAFCRDGVNQTIEAFGQLNILVNNAGEQHPVKQFEEITDEQLLQTFKTNIFGYFYMAQEALQFLRPASRIVMTTSVTAYQGNTQLIDYAATKGAIVALVRSLAKALVDREIRVNGVAPGPIWTPLIPSSFEAEHVAKFGSDVPMGRPGQPDEIAPCYVFLASDDSSYMTGQILHPNGGTIVNG